MASFAIRSRRKECPFRFVHGAVILSLLSVLPAVPAQTAPQADAVPGAPVEALQAEIDTMTLSDMYWFNMNILSVRAEEFEDSHLIHLIQTAKAQSRSASVRIASGKEIFDHYALLRESVPVHLPKAGSADLEAIRARYIELIERLVRSFGMDDLSRERYRGFQKLLAKYPEDKAGDKSIESLLRQLYRRYADLFGPRLRQQFKSYDLEELQQEIAKDYELHEDDFDFVTRIKYAKLVERYLAVLGEIFPYNIYALNPNINDPRFDELFEPEFTGTLRRHMQRWNTFFELIFMEKVVSSKGPEGAYRAMFGPLSTDNTSGDYAGGGATTWEGYKRRRYEYNWRRLEIVLKAALPEVLCDGLRMRYVQVHFDGIKSVSTIVQRIFQNWDLPGNRVAYDYRKIRALLRQEDITAAVYVTSRKLIEDPVISIRRPEKFRELMRMLAVVQTEHAKDHIKLLFDQLDTWTHYDFYRSEYDRTLVEEMKNFVNLELKRMTWIEPHVPHMSFDLVTHILMALDDVQLRLGSIGGQARPYPTQAKVILALDEIRRSSSEVMRRLIVEQSTSQVHVVSSVLHLGGLLLNYAEAGVYVLPDDTSGMTAQEIQRLQRTSDPMAEAIKRVMDWMGDLLEVNDAEMAAPRHKQRILDDLYDAFSTIELAGMQEFRDRRPVEFFEIALRVAIRLAPMAEPADIERKILRNYIAVARERSNAEYATREVIQHLANLAEEALYEDRYEKLLQVVTRLGRRR